MATPHQMHRREFLGGLTAAFGTVSLTSPRGAPVPDQDAHLEARPSALSSAKSPAPGESALGLGSVRDGLLYVPRGYDSGRPAPLAVMLHGAGRDAQRMRSTFPLADELGLVIVAPDSRGRTWDAIEGRIGPDVEFIDAALRSVFARIRVNPARVAMGGFSDGASYALGLGLANGDLVSHVIAFSPGFVTSPFRRGKPAVFISHGTQDVVLPINNTSRVIAPRLRAAGYDILYREFDGPHQLLPEIAREAFAWLVK
jgi:phospholipase/carboxylesterase